MTKQDWYQSVARVAPRDHESNLRGIVEITRRHDARVILLKVPMNLVWPRTVEVSRHHALNRKYWLPLFQEDNYLQNGLDGRPPCDTPFLSHRWLCRMPVDSLNARITNGTSYRDIEQFVAAQRRVLAGRGRDPRVRALALHRLAVIHIARGQYAQATRKLRLLSMNKALDSDPAIPAHERAEIQHTLGVSLLINGRREEARSAFVKSRETFPFAMSYEYHEAFGRVVEDLKVEAIDLPRLFEQSDPDQFGSSLMHDWVHPSPAGNQIIAEAIAARLAGKGASATLLSE